MSKPKSLLSNYFNAILGLVAFAAVIYLIATNINVFTNLLLVAVGFGAVVMVHEFGHFIVAKLSGIKVEAFSIGFPPVFAGILRTEQGWRIRILPGLFPKEDPSSLRFAEAGGTDEGGLSFTIGKKTRAGSPRPSEMGGGETEYRIGVIPFGGFIKMLGQDDIGPVKSSDDPRSYSNKPALTRVPVIAAGVVFNAISALIIFMIVFLIGINRVPAVVGGVVPDSPAARAGVRAGDEIIEIAGNSGALDYYDIAVAAALSGKDEAVPLKVRHEDGTIEQYSIAAEQKGDETKRFGIALPYILTVAKVSDANELFAKTGLLPGDHIESVNGIGVRSHWQLEELVENALLPQAVILAKRTDPVSMRTEMIVSRIKLSLVSAEIAKEAESEVGHFCYMVPRLRIEAVSKRPPTIIQKLLSLFIGKKNIDVKDELKSGDIILAIGDVENPTYKEMRDVTTEYENRKMSIRVLRTADDETEEELVIKVTPKYSKKDKKVVIGIFLVPMFDAEHSVVAKTIAIEGGPPAVAIPRGAVITAVNKTGVSSFYDVIRQIRNNAGRKVTIHYRLGEETKGEAVMDVPRTKEAVTVETILSEFVPFEPLERLYKAAGPADAVRIGYKKTVTFIAQAYITLKRLLSGLVSPKELMGPVGIITLSYSIVAERPLIDYAYFLGLISAMLAVFNLLPLLPFDGGHIVFLLVERIKGSAVNEKVQGTIAYAGWALVGALFLYVTFNDIVRSFFGISY